MEHAFTSQWGNIAVLQLILFLTTALFPGFIRRGDIIHAVVAGITSYVVSYAPMALLVYLLYTVSKLT